MGRKEEKEEEAMEEEKEEGRRGSDEVYLQSVAHFGGRDRRC